MITELAPVHNIAIPDISHLSGDWLTVARAHVSVLAWAEATPWDRRVSAAALKSLLKYYDPDVDFLKARLLPVLKSKRGQVGKTKPAAPKRKGQGKRLPAVLPPGTMNIYEAALVIGVAPKTVRKYCVEGLWKSVRVGRTIAVYRDQEFKTKQQRAG
jgi:hypothetical protein